MRLPALRSPSPAWPTARSLALPLLGVALLLALANYPLLGRELWTDEAYTASYVAHPSLADVLADVRKNEETPPLYFVALWLWARPFGSSEESLRAFSLLCGVLAVVAFGLTARRLLPPLAAAAAVVCFALSQLLQLYVFEARCYTMALLLATACVAAFEALWRRPDSRRAQAAYALSAAAMLLTSYFGVALLAAQGLLLLFQLRDRRTRARRLLSGLVMGLGVAACAGWWAPALAYQVHIAPAVTTSWTRGPLDFYFLLFSPLMGGYRRGDAFLMWQVPAAAALLLMIASALAPSASARGAALRALAAPAALQLAMMLAADVVAVRYLIVLLPGAALAAGLGAEALLRRRPYVALPLIIAVAYGLAAPLAAPRQAAPASPWASLSAEVARQGERGRDVVVFYPPWNQRVFEYYFTSEGLDLLGAHHYDDFYFHAGRPFQIRWDEGELVGLTRGYRRAWVFVDGVYVRHESLRLPFRQIGAWRDGQLELRLYELPPEEVAAGPL